MSEFISAAKRGDMDTIKKLVKEGINVNMTFGEEKTTALFWASCNNYPKVVHFLISNGAEVDQRVQWGSTALHAAAERGHRDCVFQLVKGNASLNCQNSNFLDTPLHLAAYRGHLQICQDLLRYGANLNLENRNGKTPLEEAHTRGNYKVYDVLLNYLQDSTFKYNQVLRDMQGTVSDSKPVPLRITQGKYTSNRPLSAPISYLQISSSNSSGVTGSTFQSSQNLECNKQHKEVFTECHLCKRNNVKSNDSSFETNSWNVISDKSSSQGSRANNNNNKYSNKEGYLLANQSPCTFTENGDIFEDCFGVGDFDNSNNMRYCGNGSNGYSSQTNVVGSNILLDSNQSEQFPHNGQATEVPSCHPILVSCNPKNKQMMPDNNYLNITTLHNRETTTKTSFENYKKVIDSLQIKVRQERDKLERIQKNNAILLQEREEYRAKFLELKAENYKVKYSKCLQDNERLRKELRDTKEKANSALIKLMRQYQANTGQISSLTSSGSLTPIMDHHSDAKETGKPQSKDCSTESLSPGSISMCSSDSSRSSEDSFTKKIIQSCSSCDTDHSDLYSAILPVFQSMGTSFQLSMTESLRGKLQKLMFSQEGMPRLDEPGTPWTCGTHYSLMQETPLNSHTNPKGSSSLVFRISHKNCNYILKMMVNILPSCQSNFGAEQSLLYLYQQLSAEHDILTCLPPNQNIVFVLHFFNGAQQLFEPFLPSILPKGLEVPIQLADDTTFIIMPEYPSTLAKFFSCHIKDTEEAASAVPEIFIQQKLYEILTAVMHLEENKVAHRNIKAENVFLDHELRAVLGDFGHAKRLISKDGQGIAFVDRSQVMAGNCIAWTPELEQMNRGGPESLQKEVFLEEVYHKADSYAVGKMFLDLLCYKSKNPLRCALTDIPESFSFGLRYVVKHLASTDFAQRLTAKNALILTGLMLYGPRESEITSVTDCLIWHQARMMKLLIQKSTVSRYCTTKNFAISVAESIVINSSLLERHFFSTVSGEEIWKMYPTFLHVKEMAL